MGILVYSFLLLTQLASSDLAKKKGLTGTIQFKWAQLDVSFSAEPKLKKVKKKKLEYRGVVSFEETNKKDEVQTFENPMRIQFKRNKKDNDLWDVSYISTYFNSTFQLRMATEDPIDLDTEDEIPMNANLLKCSWDFQKGFCDWYAVDKGRAILKLK
jgi:hypothetical protein